MRISAQMYNYDFVPSTVMTVGYDGLWESGQLRSPVFVRERDDLVWDNLVSTRKDKKMKLAGAEEDEIMDEEGRVLQEGGELTQPAHQQDATGGQDNQDSSPMEQQQQDSAAGGGEQRVDESVPLSPKLKRMQRLARVKEMQAQEEKEALEGGGQLQKKRGRPKGS